LRRASAGSESWDAANQNLRSGSRSGQAMLSGYRPQPQSQTKCGPCGRELTYQYPSLEPLFRAKKFLTCVTSCGCFMQLICVLLNCAGRWVGGGGWPDQVNTMELVIFNHYFNFNTGMSERFSNFLTFLLTPASTPER
jgi:hypothetical protein